MVEETRIHIKKTLKICYKITHILSILQLIKSKKCAAVNTHLL